MQHDMPVVVAVEVFIKLVVRAVVIYGDRNASSIIWFDAMIAVFGKIRKGQVAETSDMVEKILGRKATTLREYVKELQEYFS